MLDPEDDDADDRSTDYVGQHAMPPDVAAAFTALYETMKELEAAPPPATQEEGQAFMERLRPLFRKVAPYLPKV